MIHPGRTVNSFVSLIDLAPTYLDLAGIPIPETMTGNSLVEVLSSANSEQDVSTRNSILFGKERHVPGQEGPDSGGTPMRAIRTNDFLYIRNFRPDRWPAGTPNVEMAYFPGSWYGDVDNGPTKTYMIEHRDKDDHHRKLFDLAFSKRAIEELYDLRSDPGQMNSVADEPGYLEIKLNLSRQLVEELVESGDPRVLEEDPPYDRYPYYGGSPLKPDYHPDPQ